MRSLAGRHWTGFEWDREDSVWDWVVVLSCPLCDRAPDTQDHGILRCPHEAIKALRSKHIAATRASVASLPLKLQRAASKIVDMAMGDAGFCLCIGQWVTYQMDIIKELEPTMDRADIPEVLWAVHRPLAEMVGAIWDERARLLSLPLPPIALSSPLLVPRAVHVNRTRSVVSSQEQANLDSAELSWLFPHETEPDPPEIPELAANTMNIPHYSVSSPQVCTMLSEPPCPPLSVPSVDDPLGHAELLKLLSLRQKGPYRPSRCLLPFLRQPCVSRHSHRPPFVAMLISSPARVPTRAAECPSLGETGPALPVRASPRVRAGVG